MKKFKQLPTLTVAESIAWACRIAATGILAAGAGRGAGGGGAPPAGGVGLGGGGGAAVETFPINKCLIRYQVLPAAGAAGAAGVGAGAAGAGAGLAAPAAGG